MKKKEIEIGKFGPIYRQFESKPVEAIKFLRKEKNGECVKVFYRDDIGYINLVWGEVTDGVKHKGYGLAHIINKHEKEINKLGYDIASFISLIINYGSYNLKKSDTNKKVYESETFRFVIAIEKERNWLLTAFDLIKKPK